MGKRKNAANQSAQSHKRQLRFGPMMRKLLLPSRSRRWITPIVMLFLLLGIIAGAFIVSSVTQQHVQLDDGTVWITSLKDRKAARFNAKNKDVDAGVSSTDSRFDVAQHNGSTVISEGTKASNIAASKHRHQNGYRNHCRRRYRSVHQRQNRQCVGGIRFRCEIRQSHHRQAENETGIRWKNHGDA